MNSIEKSIRKREKKIIGASILAGGLVLLLLGNPKIEPVKIWSYSNPVSYTREGNKIKPNKPTSYWEDSQLHLTLYGEPMFAIGDVRRKAYGMSFEQGEVEGKLVGDSSILDDNNVLWNQVSRGHDFVGYEKSISKVHNLEEN